MEEKKQIKPSIEIKIISIIIMVIAFGAFLIRAVHPDRMKAEYKSWFDFYLLRSICYFIGPVFILRLKEWARKTIIVLSSTTILLMLLITIHKGLEFTVDLFGLIWEVFIIYFFTRPKVKEQFK